MATGEAREDGAEAAREHRRRRSSRQLRALVAGLALLQLLGIASSVHSIAHTRTAQGTIGWVIALNTMPALGVPAYWIFGRDHFEDHLSARREGGERVDPVTEALLAHMDSWLIADGSHVRAIETAEELATVPTLRGNSTRLLVDGQATFDDLFAGLEEAREYILMQWYIARDDALGRRMQALLMDKAREGVDVYFMYDGVGSMELPESYIDEMLDAGVQVEAFRSEGSLVERFQVNFRNHRKITVVDGKVAWFGGHNLGEEYLGRHERLTPWRDAHVRIEGPAALIPQLAFVQDWNFEAGEIPPLSWEPVAAAEGDEQVLVLATGPANDIEEMKLMFVNAINAAEERIWIATPYFVPDTSVITALQLAGLRGVDVRILLPRLHDHLLVKLTAYRYFKESGGTGVKFYWFNDGFMHRKAMLVDDDLAAVGSANLDNRSFRLNFEIAGLFLGPDTVADVEAMFLDDFEHSERVDPNVMDSKPFWFRLAVNAARLGAPIY